MLTEPPFADGPELGTLTVAAPALAAPARRLGYALPPRGGQAPGIDVGLLLRTLRRRLPILLALGLLGAALGLLVQRSLTPRYLSEVSLLLEPKSSASFGAETQFGSMYVDAAMIASVGSVIGSSDLLARVVASEHLDQLPEFGDAPVSRLHRWFGFLPFLRAEHVDNSPDARFGRALFRLERAISVDRVGVTYVVTIDAQAAHPDIAERIAASLADAYLSDQVERKVAATQRDSAWIAERLASVRHDLQQSEAALDAVRRRYGLLETDLGGGATLDRQAITVLNSQKLQAQADLASLQARYDQLIQARASGNLEAVPEISAATQALRDRMAENGRQLAALRAVYGDNYPEVRRLADAQASLQHQLVAETGRIAESERIAYEAAQARAQAVGAQLQQAISAEGAGTADDAGHEQLREAQRLVEANRGLYDSLLAKWQRVQEQQTREEPEARIISPASLPDQPSFPKPLLFPAGGAAALLFLGLGLTLVPVLLDRRFVSVTAVEQTLGLPVLGAIPMLRRRDVRASRQNTSRHNTSGRGGNIVDYASQVPLSRFAESLRMLRAYLRIAPDGEATVLQVTSALAGEGKSTVAATLAVSAATAGVRTVLVDADLRSASVSSMFALRGAEGLSDILEHNLPLDAVLCRRDDMPLAILGGGSSPSPRPDMLHASRFASLLRELASRYSLVILDSPPVLPVSDALVMARHADATILVVQWHATPRDVAAQAARVLRSMRAPLAGAIVNKIDLSKVSQYECGYYEYGRADGKKR